MSAHTPGPWSVGDPTGLVNQLSIKPAIGVVYGAGEEIKANARLIAAAPDMYEALALLVQYDETPNGDGVLMMMRYADAIAAARAALAKAGE